MSGNEAEPTNALTSGKPTRSQLPGFGLPVNHAPEGFTFPNSTDLAQTGRSDSALPPLMLREIAMLQIMNLITDKPEWDKKVFNDEIVSKWKGEALADSAQSITPAMMEWCIHELRYRAPIYQKTGHIRVINGDVVKSDIAVPAALKLELRDAVRPLEDVPDKDKDWHPGSDEKVLDLVHPSLFPLVYGRTRVLEDSLTSLEDCVKRCGQGKIAPVPKEEETQQKNNRYAWQSVPYVPFSARFQWLPCEVQISKDEEGKVKSKITSYINNLHPAKFPRLYQIVEEIISCAIPLWNSTLTPLKYEWRDVPWPRIEYSIVQYYWADSDDDDDNDDDEEGGEGEGEVEVNSEEGGESEAQARAGSEEGGQADDGDDDDDDNSENDGRILVVPDAPEWTGPKLAPENEVVDLVKDYGNRGLQIIVKLANIHLTPEKPRYEGGTWHVEGRLNERICATALYYYDSENITPSHLAFRQQSEATTLMEVSYEQNDDDWLYDLYGMNNWSAAIQEVGSVETREGRLFTFPNILQHQVQPFELADPTKPGHRKILALFLVDPNVRVISTANVPCQRKDWWAEEIRQTGFGLGMTNGAIRELPVELQDLVFDGVEEFPIGMEETKEMRLELMEERKGFVLQHDKAFRSMEVALCEH